MQFIAPTENADRPAFESSCLEHEAPGGAETAPFLPLKDMLEQTERRYILKALNRCRGNKVRAAQLLGVKLRTFHSRCSRLGIRRPSTPEYVPE